MRIITPGRWNRGPGPDFRGAQILDVDGRARRGDIELHLHPSAWLAHGHDGDHAYDNLLLHLVERAPTAIDSAVTADPRIPNATTLPAEQPDSHDAPVPPPCTRVVEQAGVLAVDARLRFIARRRFQRKALELAAIEPPPGPGSNDDRRALLAAARALGQPRHAEITEAAAARALSDQVDWADVQLTIPSDGWRRGRGALGTAAGVSGVWMTLLTRWNAAAASPWASVQRLSALPLAEALRELQIPKRLGRGRATQLLADAVYPLTGAWAAWAQLPGARYLRSDELRDRLDDGLDRAPSSSTGASLRWRHPQTQALLELERTRCRYWACRICPLGALARAR